MTVEVLSVKILPTQIYDEWGKVMIGAQIIIAYREGILRRHALSRVNYPVEDTKGMREYHRQKFLERMKVWSDLS